MQSDEMNGDLIVNAIAMNFSGKFSGQEVKQLGETVIKHIVEEKKISLFFGQQCNFRLTSLPVNFEPIGGQRTLILYDRRHLESNDENQYKHFLRELELRGRLPKYYLPEANYTICKMRCKYMPDMAFIAMSWMTDETQDTLRSLNLLRKLLSFTANLCAIEEMPIIIAGSFRLKLDQIKQVVYNEFEGFRCYGYKTDKPKRQQRMCNAYISCPPLKLDGVKPLVCGKVEIITTGRLPERQRDPEAAFYWDPVFTRVLRRSGTSSVTSPTSPRALSPPSFDMTEESDPQPTVEQWRANALMASSAGHSLTLSASSSTSTSVVGTRPTFESTEDTLRALLLESERIKQLVSEAENRARSRLTSTSERKEIKIGEKILGQDDKLIDKPNNSHAANKNGTGTLAGVGLSSTMEKLADDAEFRRLEAEMKVDKLTTLPGIQDATDGKKSQVASAVPQPPSTGLVPPESPLRKMPSYVELYDEELVKTNRQCYIQ